MLFPQFQRQQHSQPLRFVCQLQRIKKTIGLRDYVMNVDVF